MRRHFLPHFVARAIADLASDVGEVEPLDSLIGLLEHRSRRDDTPIAPRTIRNVASSVRGCFAEAAERMAIRRNPTSDWDAQRHLPPVEDKHRGWREQVGFSLEQVIMLTTDRRLPEGRRGIYALRLLGGRLGEAANARWRNLDRTRERLWRLTLEAALSSPMQREKATKTGATRHLPVHPVLQAFFELWWASGWAEFMGRPLHPRTSSSRAMTASSAS